VSASISPALAGLFTGGKNATRDPSSKVESTRGIIMPDDLKKKGAADRSKIAMGEEHEVKYWMKHLGVTREELQRAVDKVGNSAATVRKELGK
jgi:hypothetical protein